MFRFIGNFILEDNETKQQINFDKFDICTPGYDYLAGDIKIYLNEQNYGIARTLFKIDLLLDITNRYAKKTDFISNFTLYEVINGEKAKAINLYSVVCSEITNDENPFASLHFDHCLTEEPSNISQALIKTLEQIKIDKELEMKNFVHDHSYNNWYESKPEHGSQCQCPKCRARSSNQIITIKLI